MDVVKEAIENERAWREAHREWIEQRNREAAEDRRRILGFIQKLDELKPITPMEEKFRMDENGIEMKTRFRSKDGDLCRFETVFEGETITIRFEKREDKREENQWYTK